MRKALDLLYDAAAWAAAFFMVGVLADGARERARARWPASTCAAPTPTRATAMAAAAFLALAHTLKRGEHIRVNLFLERFGRA